LRALAIVGRADKAKKITSEIESEIENTARSKSVIIQAPSCKPWIQKPGKTFKWKQEQ
jgi:hypothetical protein